MQNISLEGEHFGSPFYFSFINFHMLKSFLPTPFIPIAFIDNLNYFLNTKSTIHGNIRASDEAAFVGNQKCNDGGNVFRLAKMS